MTCDECMEMLLEGDLRRVGDGSAFEQTPVADRENFDSHVRECERCTRAAELLREAQESLSQSLRYESARLLPPQTLAENAYRRIRRERLLWWTILPILLIVLVSIGALLTRNFGPELKRLVEPPPPVETATFSLRCLSAEQAASLLRPYLPLPQNPMWQAERFDIRPAAGGMQAVTVRAPHATMVLIPGLLSRFEQDPGAACRNDRTNP